MNRVNAFMEMSINPMKRSLSGTLTLVIVVSSTVDCAAQFGTSFSSPDFVTPTVNATYHHSHSQLTVILETVAARDDAYLFLDPQIGSLRGSLRIDSRHGPLMSPDGDEILVAGGDQTPQLDPVYFAGRYRTGTLAPIGEMQINVSKDDGFVLTGEVAPEGSFIFRGANGPAQVNLIAKYRADFSSAWGAALSYQGKFDSLFIEAFPLAGGNVGFWVPHMIVSDGSIGRDNVIGVLNGIDGSLVWSAVITTVQTTTGQDDLRYVFGDDGSLWFANVATSFLGATSDTVRLGRINADGSPGFTRTLTLPGAVYQWQYFSGDSALLCFTFKEGAADRIQLIVLNQAGEIAGSTVLNCQLRGSGRVKFTAAQREGTPYAFMRFEAGFTTIPPQQTLARIHLGTGATELRRLPPVTLSSGKFEVVTTPPGDYLSPFNNSQGLQATTTTLYDILTNPLGGPGTVAIHELPLDGSFPTCLTLTDSPVTLGSPMTPVLVNAAHLKSGAVATWSAFAMPGMVPALLSPSIQPLAVTESVICPDDGPVQALTLSIERLGATEALLRIPTQAGTHYRIERSEDVRAWSEIAARDGNGTEWTHSVSVTESPGFFRVSSGNAGN